MSKVVNVNKKAGVNMSKFPKQWVEIVNIETTPTYDRVLCADGSYFTVDVGFVSLGEIVRVRKGRVEVKMS